MKVNYGWYLRRQGSLLAEELRDRSMHLALGARMATQPISKIVNSAGERRVYVGVGTLATLIAAPISYLLATQFIYLDQQEREGIGRQGQAKVVGFLGVQSVRHGQVFPLGDRNSARIALVGGNHCTAYFDQTYDDGFLGLPDGAVVSDWGDCPIKE